MVADALVPQPFPYIDSDRGQRDVHARVRQRRASEDPVAIAMRHAPPERLRNPRKIHGPVIARHMTAAEKTPAKEPERARLLRHYLRTRMPNKRPDVYSFLDTDIVVKNTKARAALAPSAAAAATAAAQSRAHARQGPQQQPAPRVGSGAAAAPVFPADAASAAGGNTLPTTNAGTEATAPRSDAAAAANAALAPTFDPAAGALALGNSTAAAAAVPDAGDGSANDADDTSASSDDTSG